MSYNQTYISGDWKAVCDVCAFTFKASELKDRWDGLKVCVKDWEPRHSLDLLKAPKGEKALPWTRPESTDVTSGPTYISEATGVQEVTIPSGDNNGSL